MKNKINIISILLLTLFINSCVEPFEIQTETFESALVIEATITNEFKTQEIVLSRTFTFEEDGPSPETNATVKIVDDQQVQYNFQETSPGAYISTTEFAAQPNRSYELSITTSNGRVYRSFTTATPPATQIEQLSVDRITNDDDVNGVAVFVDSYDPSGNSKYYRYEYEETFKIIAPRYSEFNIIVTNDVFPDCDVALVKKPADLEERTCYRTQISSEIIVTNTNNLSEDRVDNFQVRFIPRSSYIMSHRYSALVKQYVTSREAYIFYETLRDLSGSGSLFSQSQPGFFSGNVFSEANPDEKVLGYFDVATVSTSRIFFNYNDFYAGQPLPPYIVDCSPIAPPILTNGMGDACPLISAIKSGFYKYAGPNTDPDPVLGEGDFDLVIKACGDCTELGSNVVPDFWEE